MDWALTGATIGLIIAVCYLLDWLVSKKEEDKQRITIIKWWSRLDDFSYGEAVRNANVFCNKMFDKIYGKRHFSLRCFGISFCVSIISVFILSIVMFGILKTSYDEEVFTAGNPFLFMLFAALVFNSWIDYISLIETRLILRFASRVKPLMLPVLLLVDLFLTVIVFLFCFVALLIVLGHLLLEGLPSKLGVTNFVMDFVTWDDAERGTLFYSTFSTSIIFYIYCLSTLFFKFVKLSRCRIMVALEKLEDSDHLFKALGGFLAAVVLVVKCVVEVVQHIRQI